MVNYRRNFVPGGTYFFTVTLRMRNSRRLVESIDLLRLAFRKIREAKPFQIDAMVVLPEHLHSIWTLPPNDSDYPGRWKAIKSIFTRELEKSGVPVIKRKDGSSLIWQRRYWEHTIRDTNDLNQHIDYIHFNPVKHGLVTRVVDWPYSSFHRYVRQGLLLPDWAGENVDGMTLGELILKTSSLDEATRNRGFMMLQLSSIPLCCIEATAYD
ncbi:MAG: transposase [Methylococcaceae bacterium]